MCEKLSNPNTAPKQYWSIVKQLYGKKNNPNIPIIKKDGKNFNSAKEKATLFNEYFASQSTVSVPNDFRLPILSYQTNARIGNIYITEVEVYDILKSLNTNKASGPDNIHNTILKENAASLAKPITDLFRKSLDEGVFPNKWKQANVVPIYKKTAKMTYQTIDQFRSYLASEKF